MCEPISASTAAWLAVGSGVVSFAGSAMTAVGQHRAQQAAVARSNAIAKQQQIQELQISAQRDREKGRTYNAQLDAEAAAKNAYYAQVDANQLEATRALIAVNNKLQEKRTGASFNIQRSMAEAIQAQGAVLSTGKAGQSFLLNAMDADRVLGFEMAEIEQTLYDARRASGIEAEGIRLDQHSSNVAAWNGLPASPLAPEASILPVAPIMASGPSSLALAGSLVSAGVGAVQSGLGAYGTLDQAGAIKPPPKKG